MYKFKIPRTALFAGIKGLALQEALEGASVLTLSFQFLSVVHYPRK